MKSACVGVLSIIKEHDSSLPYSQKFTIAPYWNQINPFRILQTYNLT